MKHCYAFYFVIVIITMVMAQSCSSKSVSLKVTTQSGVIEGFEQDGVKTYLGIPYAAAPIGDLRWKAPQPVEPWEGIRLTKTFGDDPMQPVIFDDMVFRGARKSEDCLFLNVWTTAESVSDGLPVLIYINGGGLMAGSGSEPRYDGAAIAKAGVIVVTANYREGIFGFFSHPELTSESEYGGSGNYGFLDQVASIQWVKDNISAFGGDPDKITIAGESAGSFSVSLLMASPLSKDLIAGAILSSGSYVMPYHSTSQKDADAMWKTLLDTNGVKGIKDARSISAVELQEMFPPMEMPDVVLDGFFMSEDPDTIFANGEQANVPMLAGWNSQESTPEQFLGGEALTAETLTTTMSAYFGEMTEEIMTAYGIFDDTGNIIYPNAVNLASDLFVGFPTWKICDYQARTSTQNVYRYKFMRARPQNNITTQFAGAVHSADIEYAMGNLGTNSNFHWLSEDYAISRLFLYFYVNFCKTGNPNGEGLPEWNSMKGNLNAVPVMYIDVNSKELVSESTENAYRTLERFYKNR